MSDCQNTVASSHPPGSFAKYVMDKFPDSLKPDDGAEPEASPLADALINAQSADSVFSPEDCQRTSRPGEHPCYAKYPTMEEISAQLAAKLALMEASRQVHSL